MNAIKIFEPAGDSVAMSIAAPRAERPLHDGGGDGFTLRRSGSRPLSFAGQQLGFHSGRRAGAARWHELFLFQMEDGRYVANIRALCQFGGGVEDQYHVHVVDTLEQAIATFENHDARQDVLAGFDLDEPGRAPAELMALAAALRYRIAEAVSAYRGAVAVFLAALQAE